MRKGTHGQYGTKVYSAWNGLKNRCLNPNAPYYHRYGGRGIKVCKRWADSFSCFFEDMGTPDEWLSIDRIDNDGHYSCGKCEECLRLGWPKNCRWATDGEQTSNSTSSRVLVHNGISDSIVGWARRLGHNVNVLRSRLFLGWSVEQTLDTPCTGHTPRASTKRYELNGESLTIVQWARKTGLRRKTISHRINAGWSIEDALTKPLLQHK